MVDFDLKKIKKNQYKQQYFTDNHNLYTTLTFTEIPCCGKKVKQIPASSGPERTSQFINITEFPSPLTLLK